MNERQGRESISLSQSIQKNGNEFFVEKLKSLHIGNLNSVIITQININSIRNKFDALVNGVRGNVDILMISETKTDDSFQTRQFYLRVTQHLTI